MRQAYFAHISQKGPVKYGQVPGSIGVLKVARQAHADRRSPLRDMG